MNKTLIPPTILTAGSTYLDIDAYACIVAMTELLQIKGNNVIAFSTAPRNYSVADFLVTEGEITNHLPDNRDGVKYIIVDVSDPDFLKSSIPLDNVVEIYDHHVGFEDYWNVRLGDNSHIEFIGAAATLIWREWKRDGFQGEISTKSACLLAAAILDNTLNLTSANTTEEDVIAFNELCTYANLDITWRSKYFSEVQKTIEADLEGSLFGDLKNIRDNYALPEKVAQLCVWNAGSILAKISYIRSLFERLNSSWMINVIDIQDHCSYFICDSREQQAKIEPIFNIKFIDSIARTQVPYLRKEIIKTSLKFKKEEETT